MIAADTGINQSFHKIGEQLLKYSDDGQFRWQ